MSQIPPQPTKKDPIVDEIGRLTDKSQLSAAIHAAQSRIEELDKDKSKTAISLVLRKGEWFAVGPRPAKGPRPTLASLGPRLSPAAALKLALEKSPEPADFELPKVEGATQRQQDPDKIGWWQDQAGNRRYYDRPAYDQAKAAWQKSHDLASDPRALAYGLTGPGLETLRQLEAQGYHLLLQD